MKKPPAAVGTAVFLVLVPGVVAGLIPWLLTDWQVRHTGGWSVPLRLLGAVVIVVGIGVLLQAFARFVTEGPVLFLAVVAVFVHSYEEPTLAERYGDQYAAYCRAVPGWLAPTHTVAVRRAWLRCRSWGFGPWPSRGRCGCLT